MVAEAQDRLDSMERALADETDLLTSRLRHFALHLLDGDEKPTQRLIHRLYWESPSLHVSEIYRAFGLKGPMEVAAKAGSYEARVPCRDCDEVRVFTVKTRTQMKALPAKHPRCESCADRWEQEQRPKVVAAERRRVEERRLDDEMLAQAMEAYVRAHPDLPDEPPGTAMYVSLTGARYGGATVRLGDLLEVREELGLSR